MGAMAASRAMVPASIRMVAREVPAVPLVAGDRVVVGAAGEVLGQGAKAGEDTAPTTSTVRGGNFASLKRRGWGRDALITNNHEKNGSIVHIHYVKWSYYIVFKSFFFSSMFVYMGREREI